MEPPMAERKINPENTTSGQEIISSGKTALRNAIITLRGRIPEQERAVSSEEITRKAVSLLKAMIDRGQLKPGAIIHLFRSFGEEVETAPLLESINEMGFKLAVPVVCHDGKLSRLILSLVGPDSRWRPGPFQIPEPHPVVQVNPDRVSLFFLPGVAFDRAGTRVGYGKGYYDRLLSGVGSDVPKIALAFSCQILETAPSSKWDIPMTMILTEEETICCD